MLKSVNPVSIARLDSAFLAGIQEFKLALTALENEIPANYVPVAGDSFHTRTLEALNQSVAVCKAYEQLIGDDKAFLKQVQEYFRTETDPWMRLSWIGNRARSKPSGFAGDFEMLIKLYDQATPATGLGGCLDLCILDLQLARAVRSRLSAAREYLLNEIDRRGTSVRILDIASGPCREYLNWPTLPIENPIEVVAMDNDPVAIDYVKTNVASKLDGGTKLNVVRYNALRTRNAKATIEHFGRFDIIYSVGLFDYLTDDHLIGVFTGLRDTLADNGSMYIAFKDTEKYEKTPYQWHLDWFFYQRTQQDVLELYRKAGFDVESIQMTRDTTGIIINFISQHTSSTIQRLDAASPIMGTTRMPAQVETVQ